MKKTMPLLLLITFVSPSLFASEQDVDQYFKAADKGFYIVMLDLLQKNKLSPQEIMNAKKDDATMLLAAFNGFKLASEKYTPARATTLLTEIVTRLLARLSAQDVKKYINIETKNDITPLFAASKLGIVNLAVLLHDKGAYSITKTGKKASSFTTNAQLKSILTQWENLEGDWVLINK